MARPVDGSIGSGEMGYQAVVWAISTADMNLRVESSWTNPGLRVPPELTGSLGDMLELVHPDDRRAARQRIESLMSGEAEAAALELRLKVAGSYRWSLVRGSPSARDEDERVTEVSGICMDIDDLKRAEEELAASERRFRTFSDLSPVAIMIHRDGVWTYANRTALRMTGYDESEMIGMPFWELVHPVDREMVKARGLARRRGEHPPDSYQLRIVTRDGSIRWADLRARALEPEQGVVPVLISAQDITDRKRVELTREVLMEIARKAHTLDSVQDLYPAIQKALGSLFDTTNM
ncbi:MAG: PAS domain-containing protein, partial [Candidatus Fermentibacterota bacterium]